MRFKPFILLLLIFDLLISFQARSQEKTVIVLNQADKFIGENIDGTTINFLSGNVILIHDSTTFYCDSAEINRQYNRFKAFGNVFVLMSDSVKLYGDRLTYEGNTKITHVYDNVRLIDKKATLYTDYLIYYRIGKKGVFNTGGRIVDEENELTSRVGEYYPNLKKFFFRNNVVVTTPDKVIKSDTLQYNTQTKIVYFNGYSTLTSEDDYMFAFKGWSDTKNNLTSLKHHATVKHKNQIIYGDSVYYDKEREYGYASKNAFLMDPEKEVIIEGQIVEYMIQQGYGYATDSAFAVLIDQNDSLFLHSDTLKMLFDTAGKADKLLAYNKTKFYRKNLQGACDSLVYDMRDSVISMFFEPVLWSNDNQLTSETMNIFMTNKVADSLVMSNSAFIVSEDSTNTYNQIKGRDVVGYFKDNELFKIIVNGNSETVYYVRNDDTKELTGINKALASNMVIYLSEREIVSILYLDNPQATFYPETEISEEEKLLKGFKWLDKMRPKTKKDIFRNP